MFSKYFKFNRENFSNSTDFLALKGNLAINGNLNASNISLEQTSTINFGNHKLSIDKDGQITINGKKVSFMGVPVVKQATAVVKQATPVVKQATPVVKQATAVVKQATAVVKEGAPKPYTYIGRKAVHEGNSDQGFAGQKISFEEASRKCNIDTNCGGIMKNTKSNTFWGKKKSVVDKYMKKGKWDTENGDWEFWTKTGNSGKKPYTYIGRKAVHEHRSDQGFANQKISLEEASRKCSADPNCGGIMRNTKSNTFWGKKKSVVDKYMKKGKWDTENGDWEFWTKTDKLNKVVATPTSVGNTSSSFIKSNKCKTDGTWYNPLNMPGQGRTVGTPEQCRQRCINTPGCKYFNNFPNGGCHISTGKDGSGINRGNPTKISGSITCNINESFKNTEKFTNTSSIGMYSISGQYIKF